MEIDKLIEEFERKLKIQRYSDSSIKNYASAVNSFLQIAEKKYGHPAQLGETEIEKYVHWKIEKHSISGSYQRIIVASIEKFYHSVVGRTLNIKHLYPSRKQKTIPKYLTTAEIKNMIDATENLKHKCIISLLYGCGLRLSELLNLKITDIDSENMIVNVRQAKGNKDRVVMFPEILLEQLRNYYRKFKPSDYLIEGQNGSMYSPKSVQMIVKIAAQKVGIKKKVTPHVLRHREFHKQQIINRLNCLSI